MDAFLIISLSVIFGLWGLAAIVYPFMEERERKRFYKKYKKHTDGDNT